ncbi:MAG: SdrD B-like domain-containing protein [Chitinophagales bacterium]
MSCDGEGGVNLTANLSGGKSPYTYLWSTGTTTQTISNVGEGTYFVTVTDANNCTAEAAYTINAPAPMEASVTAKTDETCDGSNNGSATVTVSGGTPAYTVQWKLNGSVVKTGLSVTGLADGFYSVEVTDSKGCKAYTSVEIGQGVILAPSVSVNDADCGKSNGSITVSVGSAGTYSYTLTPGNITATSGSSYTFENLSGGTYSISIASNVGSCTTTVPNINVSGPGQPAIVFTANPVDCDNQGGSITATVSGGQSPYTFVWSDGTVETTSGVSTIDNLAPGTYMLTVTDAEDCEAIGAYNLPQKYPVDVTIISKTDEICSGAADGTASVAISGGSGTYSSIQWQLNGTTVKTGNSVSGLAAGYYTVIVTDSEGCTGLANVEILEGLEVSPTIQVEAADCDKNNGSITVFAGSAGTFTYVLNPGNITATTGASHIFENLSGGTYSVTVTSEEGCEGVVSGINVSGPDSPSVTVAINNEVDCYNQGGSMTATATGGTPPYMFIWSNGFVQTVSAAPYTSSINNLLSGSYSVTVRDDNNCEAVGGATLIPNTPINIDITAITHETCFGENDGTATIEVSGGSPNYTIVWKLNGQTVAQGLSVTDLKPGFYLVEVTDSKGCKETANIQIEQGVAPTPGTLVVQDPINGMFCSNNKVTALTATPPSIPAGFQALYLLSQNNVVVAVSAVPQFGPGLPPGDYMIHSLVYNSASFNTASIIPNSTTISQINSTLIQGGGTICAALLVQGPTFTIEPCEIDLELTKTASVPAGSNVTIGDTFTYTLSVINKGPAQATGVVVLDNLPSQLQFISASGGAYSPGTGEWTVGTLNVNQTKTINLTVKVIDSGEIYNLAQVSEADQPDVDSEPGNLGDTPAEDDEDDYPLTGVGLIDLELNKTTNVTEAGVGDDIVYTITVTNLGPSVATGVTVGDQLPAQLQYVSSDASQGSYAGDTWTIGTIEVGKTVTLDITATVLQAGSITNIAQVTDANEEDVDSTPDNNDPNEDDQDDTTITGKLIDLELTKTANVTSVNVGDTFTYTITLSNEGPSDATGVTVLEDLPSQVEYVSSSATLGAYNENTSTWTVGDLAADGSATLSILVKVVQSGTFRNVSQVSGANEPDIDSTPNNDNGDQSEDDEDGVDVVGEQIDLELQKTASVTTVGVGENFVYTITLSNEGPSDATGVTVRDNLPAQVAYVSSDGNYNATTGIWTVGSIAAGEIQTLNITVTMLVEAEGVLNVAEVNTADQPDIDSEPDNDNPTEDDQDEIAVGGIAADLELDKDVSTSVVNLGEEVVFTITVENNGGANATGVTVSDQLPAGLEYVSYDSTLGTYDPATGIWTIGEIYAGEEEKLYITVVVNALGPITNIAQIETSDQADPDSTPGNDVPTEDDQDEETVSAKLIDLELAKTADATSVNVGDTFTYTITLSNEGPSDATGVTVLDDLPSQVEFISSTATLGAYNENTSTWTIGDLAVGQEVSLNITVKVIEAGMFENVAQVSGANEPDIDSTPNNDNGDQSEDDEDAVEVMGEQIDLELQKTASAQEVGIGQQFTYTLTLVNKGPSNATNVTVSDQLPQGVTFVSASPSSYNATTGIWNVGSLAAGATAQLDITVTLNVEDEVTNYAQVQSADQPDIDSEPGNNSDSEDDDDEVTIGGIAADLELDKDVDKNLVNLGDTVTFTILVENNGGANATGVTVLDQLPAGLVYVSYDSTIGTYNPTTGIWTIGEIYAGENEILHIQAIVNSVTNITNVAQIETVDQPDPDSTPGNNDPTEDDQDEETVGAKLIDLELNKTVDKISGVLGDQFVYTITITNEGPSDATGVVVGDNLPSEVTYVSHGQSTGYYNPVSSYWTVGDLAVGEVQTLIITVEATLDGNNIINIAQVVEANEPDIDSTPNNDNGDQSEDDESAAIISVQPLGSIGDYVWFDENGDGIQDPGEQGIPNVTVTLTYPDGTTVTTTTDDTGHYIFDNLPAGNYVVTVGEGPDGTTLSTPATDNVNLGAGENYVDADFGFTGELIDLELQKTANATEGLLIGDTFTYTLTITNEGPGDATGVQVLDELPAQVSYVSSTASLGSYNSGTNIWNIGSIPANQSYTLDIVVKIEQSGVFENIAQVYTADQTDIDSTPNNDNGDQSEDDEDSVIVSSTGLADLELTKETDTQVVGVGEQITYTVALVNYGPNTATNVEVTDQLPSGLTFVSADATQGSYNAATGLWTIGDVTVNKTVKLEITATVMTAGSVTNTAEVTAVDQYDPDSTPDNNNPAEDDQDAVVITAKQIDLELQKTANVTAARHKAYSSGTGMQMQFGANETITLTISAEIVSGGTITNIAQVMSADQMDRQYAK